MLFSGGKANLIFGVGASSFSKRVLLEHLSWQEGADIDVGTLHPDPSILNDLKRSCMCSGHMNLGTQTLMWEVDVAATSAESLQRFHSLLPWQRYAEGGCVYVLISSGGANAGNLVSIFLDALESNKKEGVTVRVNVVCFDASASESLKEAKEKFSKEGINRSQRLCIVNYTMANPTVDEFKEAGLLCVGLFKQVYPLQPDEGSNTLSLAIDTIDTSKY